MTNPIRLGVLGAAAIVPMALTWPAKNVPEIQVTTVAARDPKRAETFARRNRIPHVHKSYDDLLNDPQVDAIYNPLPNGLHAEWTIKALRAGKHVLCEKPFSSNAKEAVEMANAAKETGKVLYEAFAYRTHPLTMHMKEVMSSGQIGKIQKIEARFGFLNMNLKNIRYRYDLAGGAQMDAGCYPVSLVRFLVGEEPAVTQAAAKVVRPQVDSRMESWLRFPNGTEAHVICDMLSPRLFDSFLKVWGDGGEMTVISPFQPHIFNLVTVRNAKDVMRKRIPGPNAYVSQLRTFAAAIQTGTSFNTNPQDAINNMKVIDAIYEKAGLPPRGT